jgi:hypothetical protein
LYVDNEVEQLLQRVLIEFAISFGGRINATELFTTAGM